MCAADVSFAITNGIFIVFRHGLKEFIIFLMNSVRYLDDPVDNNQEALNIRIVLT